MCRDIFYMTIIIIVKQGACGASPALRAGTPLPHPLFSGILFIRAALDLNVSLEALTSARYARCGQGFKVHNTAKPWFGSNGPNFKIWHNITASSLRQSASDKCSLSKNRYRANSRPQLDAVKIMKRWEAQYAGDANRPFDERCRLCTDMHDERPSSRYYTIGFPTRAKHN